MTIKLSTPGAMKAINLLSSENVVINTKNHLEQLSSTNKFPENSNATSLIEVLFLGASYIEPENQREILGSIDFAAAPNSITVIVGPTGAGKSTILDLTIGVIEPTNGKISIANLHPGKFIEANPDLVRYVPQNVEIRSSTLLENIVFRSTFKPSDDQRLLEVLEITKLASVVESLPNGVQTVLGDGGQVLSGGEIQRIGIARAIFDQPKLLLLDEVTSSLDRETENSILQMITTLREQMTIIMIAHRVSNMEIADQIIYIKDGIIEDKGKLSEVQARNREFFEDHKG
jgi:ABC-type transport system involved in cytochrome bd biosynthesis fused ATPase/permease subunit